jgi:hypothetical protein
VLVLHRDTCSQACRGQRRAGTASHNRQSTCAAALTMGVLLAHVVRLPLIIGGRGWDVGRGG